jgi:hypothetical protein
MSLIDNRKVLKSWKVVDKYEAVMNTREQCDCKPLSVKCVNVRRDGTRVTVSASAEAGPACTVRYPSVACGEAAIPQLSPEFDLSRRL